jgi:diguanylate cyclase (GGDEF)-like protein
LLNKLSLRLNKIFRTLNKHYFWVEVLFITIFSVIIFWFAQEHDAFEYLVEVSREHEDLELDEFFTLLMISAFALIVVTYRNGVYLRIEMKRRVVVEKEIKRLAFYDGLTGLPNRDLCTNRLEHTLAHAARDNTMAAVLFIDLDNFKEVNDTFGHDGGDELLKEAAQRLSSDIRSGDTLARIAGDEFVIVLESLSSVSDISRLSEQLLDKIAQPFILDGQEAYVGISIGIAIFPSDGSNINELMKNADTAMYYAKHSGKNTFKFFSPSLNQESETKIKISVQLRKAIERNEFSLHYQPIVNACTGRITGAEALIRWDSQRLGVVSPAVFIPIAEEIGIISSIGDWVLLEACRQNKRWQQQGFPSIIVSVNMSARELNSLSFTESVEQCLTQTGLVAKYLELELTETAIMKNIEQSITQLNYLRLLGVSIALDDFGKGYSSMSYLRKLKLTRIKIDRSFIKNIPESEEDTITTHAMVHLANNLGLKVTIEGIETEAQHEFIRTTLSDCAQGYYFSKPVSSEDFELLFDSEYLPNSH